MKDYKYFGKCQVCKIDFKENDDIVVCPECGAPYHRDCYKLHGQCVYLDKHNTNFTYSRPTESKSLECDKNVSEKKCLCCLKENSDDASFCVYCGFPLLPSKTLIHGVPFSSPFDPLLELDKDEKIEDIKISEFAQYIKSNLFYYLPIFKSIHDKNKSRFNFCAFLFSGAWFLYRKLYKIGTVITAVLTLLMILSSFLDFVYIPQILMPVLKNVGITSIYDITVNKSSTILEQVLLLPAAQQFCLVLPFLIKIVQLIIMLVSGFLANRIYFKNCCSKIRKIKVLCKDNSQLLSEKMNHYGGTNFKIVVLLIICYMIIEYLPTFVI